MTVKSALTSDELTYLTLPSTAQAYLSVVNNSEMATARINQVFTSFPIAQVTVDTVSANWGDVGPGMTVWVGTTPGGQEVGVYRVRKAGNSTTLYISETAEGDPGLLTPDVRTGSFNDNQYITVYLRRRDLWTIIPRIVMPDGTIYEDYDRAMTTENIQPSPVCNVTIAQKFGHYATFVDSGQSYATITFSVVGLPWPNSTTINTYAWVAPASWSSPVSGSTSSSSVTYHVPADDENYEIAVTVIDNLSYSTTAYRSVWVHERTGANAPISNIEIGTDTWDRTGARMSVTVKGPRAADIVLGAMVHVWFTMSWGGHDIPSAATAMTGWIIDITENIENPVPSVTLSIAGPSYILEHRGAYSQYFELASPATTWQQLIAINSYVDFWIYWCLRQRSTVLDLFNLTLLGIANTQGRMPVTKIESAGNLLSQVKDIAKQYRANVGCNPDGEIMVRLIPSMVNFADRSAITIRATLTEYRLKKMTAQRNILGEVGRVHGEGFYWDGVSPQPLPMLSDAPGDAPGQWPGEDRLQKQVVDGQSDLNDRTGHYLAARNNPYKNIGYDLAHNWSVIYPAEMQFLQEGIAANVTPLRQARTRKVVPLSVTRKWQKNGTIALAVTAEAETVGVAGKTVPVPPPVVVSYGDHSGDIIPITPRDPYGPEDSYEPDSGIMVVEDAKVHQLKTMRSGVVTTVEISASAPLRSALGNAQNACYDPYNLNRLLVIGASGILACTNVHTATGTGDAAWTAVNSYPGTSSEQYGWQIVGANTRRGYFGWLYWHNDGGARLGRYFYTTDDFATVHSTLLPGPIPLWNDTFYDVGHAVLCIDPRGSGKIKISVFMNALWGYTGCYTYESNDWGLSFTLRSPSLGFYDLGIPFNLPDRNPNNAFGYLIGNNAAGNSTGVLSMKAGSNTATVAISDDYTYSRTSNNVHTFTGSAQAITAIYNLGPHLAQWAVVRSNDGGRSWFSSTLSTNTDSKVAGLNGWPTNRNYLLAAGWYGLYSTIDGCRTWKHLLGFGAPNTMAVATVWAAANPLEKYPVGGVR